MNHHKNGTITVGAPGSYMYLISGLEDLLKGKGSNAPKVFEVYHVKSKIVEAGKKIGKTIPEMEADVAYLFRAN